MARVRRRRIRQAIAPEPTDAQRADMRAQADDMRRRARLVLDDPDEALRQSIERHRKEYR